MKTMVQHHYGPPDALALADAAVPVPGDQEVLVRVRAAGLNVADDLIARGTPYALRLVAGLRRPNHQVRGVDVAGTVVALGTGVAGLRPGDQVFGATTDAMHGGAFAEYVCAPQSHLVRKPERLDFVQAAALPVASVTAWKALTEAARLRPGDRVLINGASGGVGTCAVQIAKALGAHVTGVCSGHNADLVRSLGADEIIDHTREDFTRTRERYDVLLDNVSNRPLRACLRVLTPTGTLVPNGNTPGRWLGGIGRIARARGMAPFVRRRVRTCHGLPDRPSLKAVTGLVEAGDLNPVVDRVYPLDALPEALARLEGHHVRGKIVITCDASPTIEPGHVSPAPARRSGLERAVRQYRPGRARHAENTVMTVLVGAGLVPHAFLLRTRGRKTGRRRTNPVIPVRHGATQWLVAPYGAVSWVHNARAAGQVSIGRFGRWRTYTVREITSQVEAGPILQRYLHMAPAPRPYFRASKDSPVEDFVAEARRHPVFELLPTRSSPPRGGRAGTYGNGV
jgi:deazaflavin-dependent oxidoreductase (nitroreductase family)